MKTMDLLKMLLLCFAMHTVVTSGSAQEKPKAFGEKFTAIVRAMNANAKLVRDDFIAKPCRQKFWTKQQVAKINQNINLDFLNTGFFLDEMRALDKQMQDLNINAGQFESEADFALYCFHNFPVFEKFYQGLTGGGNHLSDDQNKVSKIRKLREKISRLLHGRHIVGNNEFRIDNCAIKVNTFLEWAFFDKPTAGWKVIVEITQRCNCEYMKQSDLMYARAEVNATIEGFFEGTKTTINKVSPSTLTIKELDCCPPSDRASFDDLLRSGEDYGDQEVPDGYFGYLAGLGYNGSNKEFSYCIGLEYLRTISEGKAGFWSVGLGGNFVGASTGSDTDISTSSFSLGPKLEWGGKDKGKHTFSPLLGIYGNYNYGKLKVREIKDDLRGLDIGAYAGIRADYGKGSLNIQIGLARYNRTTLENEAGMKFTDDSFSVNLFKNPTVHFIYRRER